MNRRSLLKALVVLPAIPIILPTPAGDVSGQAYKLEAGKRYLIIFKPGMPADAANAAFEALESLKIDWAGVVADNPDDAIRLYEFGNGQPIPR